MEICNSNCNVRAGYKGSLALTLFLLHCMRIWGSWFAAQITRISSQQSAEIQHCTCCFHSPSTVLLEPHLLAQTLHFHLAPTFTSPIVPTKGASARLTTRATHCFLKAAVNCSRLLLPLGCGQATKKECGPNWIPKYHEMWYVKVTS